VESTFEAETLLAFGRYMEAAKISLHKNQIQFVSSMQKMKFDRPQYITDYCVLMKSNKLVHFG